MGNAVSREQIVKGTVMANFCKAIGSIMFGLYQSNIRNQLGVIRLSG